MDEDSPFYVRDSFNTAEDALNAVVLLHESGGVDQITMGAVARLLKMSRSSVHQAHGNITGFYVSLISRFSFRWHDWFSTGYGDPTPVRLPDAPSDQVGVRVWSSLRTLAAAQAQAGNTEPWQAVERVLGWERRFLGSAIRDAGGPWPEPATINGLLAFADGLRLQMVAPIDPLPAGDASELVLGYWTEVLRLPPRALDSDS
ncbi:MAG TPA: hypothetical protein VJ872_03955 [Nocardioides sp.]|nr:hypothetical protein [Nocardioides sp.]